MRPGASLEIGEFPDGGGLGFSMKERQGVPRSLLTAYRFRGICENLNGERPGGLLG
jgi:hypothetical protein